MYDRKLLIKLQPSFTYGATNGCFESDGNFMAMPEPDPKEQEGAFRCEVLKLLKGAGFCDISYEWFR